MLKTENRILGGIITGTSFYEDNNNEKNYSVSFKRADNREMTVSVDRQYFERCVHGKQAIFDIDVVMENDGDINHYDKKLSRAKHIKFVGIDIDINAYKERMTEDLIWLSRYAKPLQDMKAKRQLWMILVGLVFIIGGLLLIAAVPFKIFNQISNGKRYSDFIYTEGEVIDQDWSLSTTNHDNDDIYYDIEVKIQYEADGNKYVITENINNQRSSTVFTKQDMIYNQSNPNEAYLASYDVIAKRYIPDGGNSWVSYILTFAIFLVMGIICTVVGVIVTFG